MPEDEWKESAAAQARMKELGLKDEDELQSWFITHIDKWLAARGRRLIGWDEILEGGLAPGAAVMSWRGEKGGIAAAKAGHDVVMAPEKPTYFDYDNSENEPLPIRTAEHARRGLRVRAGAEGAERRRGGARPRRAGAALDRVHAQPAAHGVHGLAAPDRAGRGALVTARDTRRGGVREAASRHISSGCGSST